MDRYFALAPAEKIRYLDERINRSEKMRKEWQQKGAATRGAGAKGGSPGGLPGGPGGGFAAGAGQSGGPGQRTPPTAEEREKRRKEHLDRTTPEERAQRDRFRKDMADRRKQRGLPSRG
jgi:hypothetical protein